MIFLVFAFVIICIAALAFSTKGLIPIIKNGNALTKVLGVVMLLSETATFVYIFVEYARS